MRSPASRLASKLLDAFVACDRAPAANAGVVLTNDVEEAPQPASNAPDATSSVSDWRRSTLSSVVLRGSDGAGSTNRMKPIPHRSGLVPISYQSEGVRRNLVGRGFESRPRYPGRPGRRTCKSPAGRPRPRGPSVRAAFVVG